MTCAGLLAFCSNMATVSDVESEEVILHPRPAPAQVEHLRLGGKTLLVSKSCAKVKGGEVSSAGELTRDVPGCVGSIETAWMRTLSPLHQFDAQASGRLPNSVSESRSDDWVSRASRLHQY